MNFGAQVACARTRDPAEYELVLRPWELQCVPQAAGKFEHSIAAIRSQSFILYRERYHLAVNLQGLAPEGMLAFCIPLEFDSQAYFWGDRLGNSDIPCALPGPLEVKFAGPRNHLVILIAIHHLRQFQSDESFARLEAAAFSHRFQAPTDEIRDFARWASRLLDAAELHPATMEHPSVAESILDEIVAFLIRVADHQPPPWTVAPIAARRKGLSRALEFLRYRLSARVTLGELCREAGVSERSLEVAFREEFGISPTEFMRRRKLHAARQKLLIAHWEETSVSQIALECGFHEFGRFAVEYRRLFGVSPSKTLRRELAAQKQ